MQIKSRLQLGSSKSKFNQRHSDSNQFRPKQKNNIKKFLYVWKFKCKIGNSNLLLLLFQLHFKKSPDGCKSLAAKKGITFCKICKILVQKGYSCLWTNELCSQWKWTKWTKCWTNKISISTASWLFLVSEIFQSFITMSIHKITFIFFIKCKKNNKLD